MHKKHATKTPVKLSGSILTLPIDFKDQRHEKGFNQLRPTFEEFVNASLLNGAQFAIRRISTAYQDHVKQPIFKEAEINDLGYRFLHELNRIEDAIEIFNYNVDSYPHSANAYDSLGEAYYLEGNLGLALNYYKKSLKLNPDNQNAVHMLRQLRQGH